MKHPVSQLSVTTLYLVVFRTSQSCRLKGFPFSCRMKKPKFCQLFFFFFKSKHRVVSLRSNKMCWMHFVLPGNIFQDDFLWKLWSLNLFLYSCLLHLFYHCWLLSFLVCYHTGGTVWSHLTTCNHMRQTKQGSAYNKNCPWHWICCFFVFLNSALRLFPCFCLTVLGIWHHFKKII